MNGRLIAGVGLLTLAACGRGGGEAERQAAAGNAVSVAPGDISIATPNGTVQVRSGGATTGLPEGIPAYPNADSTQNIDVNGGSAPGGGRILSFGTPDAPAQVIAFYAQAVAGAGYAIVNRMDMDATTSLTARRDTGQVVNIVATRTEEGTRVQIVVAAEGG